MSARVPPRRPPQDAYFVRCGRDTMTQDDIDHGRLIVLVGFAPVRPAEFVIFRIGRVPYTSRRARHPIRQER